MIKVGDCECYSMTCKTCNPPDPVRKSLRDVNERWKEQLKEKTDA